MPSWLRPCEGASVVLGCIESVGALRAGSRMQNQLRVKW